MRFEGRVEKQGRYWSIEVPILGVATQGRTRAEAYRMIADAIEMLVNKSGFSVQVFAGDGGYFELGSTDLSSLTVLMLKRQRMLNGATLAEAAERLDATSPNTYARYEQGRTKPSPEQLGRLCGAVRPSSDLLLATSRQRKLA